MDENCVAKSLQKIKFPHAKRLSEKKSLKQKLQTTSCDRQNFFLFWQDPKNVGSRAKMSCWALARVTPWPKWSLCSLASLRIFCTGEMILPYLFYLNLQINNPFLRTTLLCMLKKAQNWQFKHQVYFEEKTEPKWFFNNAILAIFMAF